MAGLRILAPAALLVVAALAAARAAAPATFHGRSVDDRRYQASIVNADYGAYDDVEVRFHDETAYVYFHRGGRLVLMLEEAEITDPHEIRAYDPRRGITWEIDVKDLGA